MSTLNARHIRAALGQLPDLGAGACIGHDPREWDDAGTPFAYTLCMGCPVRDACLDDARQDPNTADQLRGGVWFNTYGRPQKRPAYLIPMKPCNDCGRPMVRGRHTPPRGHVQHSARGLCQTCYARASHTGTLPTNRQYRPRGAAVTEWKQLDERGFTMREAAAIIGIRVDSLRHMVNRARRTGAE